MAPVSDGLEQRSNPLTQLKSWTETPPYPPALRVLQASSTFTTYTVHSQVNKGLGSVGTFRFFALVGST
jgi:hypothetical protein